MEIGRWRGLSTLGVGNVSWGKNPPSRGGTPGWLCTPEDPYEIWTSADFALLGWHLDTLDAHIVLRADLDMSGVLLYPLGDMGPFTGVFNGNGFVIRSAVIHQPDSNYVGIFGCLGSGGKITNLGIEEADISGKYSVGGLVGDSRAGTVTASYATGSVSGIRNVGGLVGKTSSGVITTCFATVSVSGSDYVGGLVGQTVFGTTIITCYAAGSLSGESGLGGLVGKSDDTIITSCCATGSVSGLYRIGGLVGKAYSSTITSCYATGAVSGYENVGGLVAYTSSCAIENCYAAGTVIATKSRGGLVGLNYAGSGSFTMCFWNKKVNPALNGIGNMSGSLDVIGETTENMQKAGTFLNKGWDFVNETDNGTDNIWRLCIDGQDYPRLAWQSLPGDTACPDGLALDDLAFFASRFLEADCETKNNCANTDIDRSGTVDAADLLSWIDYWLTIP